MSDICYSMCRIRSMLNPFIMVPLCFTQLVLAQSFNIAKMAISTTKNNICSEHYYIYICKIINAAIRIINEKI